VGKKIVFLDRDGVINKLVERDGRLVSPRIFNDFEILPGVPDAIRVLSDTGYEVVVVTNQPDISRGLMRLEELELMHNLVNALGVREIRVCPHSDEDHCKCRKPKPGLLAEYLESLDDFVLEKWMVGDRETDIICGTLVGANTILVSRASGSESMAKHTVRDLGQATRVIFSVQAEFDKTGD
jgi:D-glycero-D-manno-heptose 1,7-bisphosphate phosphatase